MVRDNANHTCKLLFAAGAVIWLFLTAFQFVDYSRSTGGEPAQPHAAAPAHEVWRMASH